MAHLMTGNDHMASVREKPWHGIGTILPDLATAQEMLMAARLNWTVSKEPMLVENPVTGEIMRVPDQYLTMRSDNQGILGPVGKDYTVFNNIECFELLDTITQDPNGPKYETAGSIRDGRVVYAMLRVPGFIQVTPRDIIHPYLMIANSHDGSKAITITFTSVRVVCNNTMQAAIKGSDCLFRMKHFSGVSEKAEAAQDFLGIIRQTQENVMDMITELQSFEPTKEEVAKVCANLFGSDSTRSKNITAEVTELTYNGEANRLAGVTGSGWDFLNGLTEYADHFRTVKAGSDNPAKIAEARFDSAFFGSANTMKDKALALVLAIPVGRK